MQRCCGCRGGNITLTACVCLGWCPCRGHWTQLLVPPDPAWGRSCSECHPWAPAPPPPVRALGLQWAPKISHGAYPESSCPGHAALWHRQPSDLLLLRTCFLFTLSFSHLPSCPAAVQEDLRVQGMVLRVCVTHRRAGGAWHGWTLAGEPAGLDNSVKFYITFVLCSKAVAYNSKIYFSLKSF